ncbi:hypothetical protein MKQ70_00535 [Chitinophaga sedimenti]|uniref:hypothetical protein n=1 Tax=Chitinophaga sedimenti TaxID=2033606 RepID=UPI0020058465|nr:hypothetical protein [Chitinophaga sedimenti]MCK7553569.1 hypothetical protein [Chitinophaga sedimenti]
MEKISATSYSSSIDFNSFISTWKSSGFMSSTGCAEAEKKGHWRAGKIQNSGPYNS